MPTRARDPNRDPRALTLGAGSPAAERPATMDEGGPPPDGPKMLVAQTSKAIYAMQRKLESAEKWARSVKTALVDNEGNIDVSRVFTSQVSNSLE